MLRSNRCRRWVTASPRCRLDFLLIPPTLLQSTHTCRACPTPSSPSCGSSSCCCCCCPSQSTVSHAVAIDSSFLLPRPLLINIHTHTPGFHPRPSPTPTPAAGRTASSSAFLPSARAARLPTAIATPSLRRPLQASAADGAAAPAPSSPTARLCRNCKQYYEPGENHDRACRYHTKAYTGDTKRKGDWSASADRVRALQRVEWRGWIHRSVLGWDG